LLHYGSEFLPFLELLPGLSDKDATWAVKGEDAACESDDSRSLFEDDEEDEMIVADTDIPPAPPTTNVRPGTSPSATRERKPSLPQSRPHTSSFAQESPETSGRQLIKDLFKVAQEVNMIDSDEIAYEISRIEAKMFLDIEVCSKKVLMLRHPLRWTFSIATTLAPAHVYVWQEGPPNRHHRPLQQVLKSFSLLVGLCLVEHPNADSLASKGGVAHPMPRQAKNAREANREIHRGGSEAAKSEQLLGSACLCGGHQQLHLPNGRYNGDI
jgi:hypothetical protein